MDLIDSTRAFPGYAPFRRLRVILHGVSPKTLTERLRFLEDQGVVQRTIYPEIPPKVEYKLTEHGRNAWPASRRYVIGGNHSEDRLRAFAQKFLLPALRTR